MGQRVVVGLGADATSVDVDTFDDDVPNGTPRDFAGKPCIFYDGYWIRRYDLTEQTFRDKKNLIDQLTKRVFHHTEPGINTPGYKLDDARAAYESETDPSRRRVCAAMLAGALLNRANDIFTHVVELEEQGVHIEPQNELLRECGRCLRESLDLGPHVKHYSGEEGLDELWGEPFKAFSLPLEEFYAGRYVKIAQSMRAIDSIAGRMIDRMAGLPGFEGLDALVQRFAAAAKAECETLKRDPVIFQVWPEFVATGEQLAEFTPVLSGPQAELRAEILFPALNMIREGQQLVTWIATARVPMPRSMENYFAAMDLAMERIQRHGQELNAG